MRDTEVNKALEKARLVVEAVTFDDSGFNGQGGNGGLLSRETIRAVDELRLALGDIREDGDRDVA